MELSAEEIRKILPHRYPMLLVDRITELVPGQMVALLSKEENQGKLALFGGVKSCRFRKQVVPGDVLEMTCEIKDLRGPVGSGICEARVDGTLACRAEILFALTDRKN